MPDKPCRSKKVVKKPRDLTEAHPHSLKPVMLIELSRRTRKHGKEADDQAATECALELNHREVACCEAP
jgi:hypothetical protein